MLFLSLLLACGPQPAVVAGAPTPGGGDSDPRFVLEEGASLPVPAGGAGGAQAASLRLEWMQWCPTPEDPERADWVPLADGDRFTFYEWYAPTACVRVRGAELPCLNGTVVFSADGGPFVEIAGGSLYCHQTRVWHEDDVGSYAEVEVLFQRTDWDQQYDSLGDGAVVALSWDLVETEINGETGEVTQSGVGARGQLTLTAALE